MYAIVILCCASIALTVDATSTLPKSVNSMGFEDVFAGQKLVAELLESLVVVSETKCALACNKNEWCRSFNFCGADTCELNVHDIYSSYQATTLLTVAPNCKYVGMRKASVPVCSEHGVFATTMDDAPSGVCRLNNKRVDMEWRWADPIIVDIPGEWRHVDEFYMVKDVAHGGIAIPGTPVRQETWVRFTDDVMQFNEARDYCINLGGDLFSNLDGSMDQLQFFRDRLVNKIHWLGIVRDSAEVWKTVEGEVIGPERLLWGSGQPDNWGNNENNVVSGFFGFPTLTDVNMYSWASVMCDML